MVLDIALLLAEADSPHVAEAAPRAGTTTHAGANRLCTPQETCRSSRDVAKVPAQQDFRFLPGLGKIRAGKKNPRGMEASAWFQFQPGIEEDISFFS